MTRLLSQRLGFACCLLLCLARTLATASSAEPLPSGAEVMQRILEQASQSARGGETNSYIYEKRTLVEEMDENDTVVSSTEKIYAVTSIGGMPFSRLIRIQGRDLTPEELEKQNRREQRFRQKLTNVNLKEKAAKKESWITPDLLNRFEFTVTGRESYLRRPVLVVTFKARASSPEETIQDKVMKQMSGTLWVDERDSQVAKLEAGLQKSISLGWLGMLGSVTRCHLAIERFRMPDGEWVNGRQRMFIVARQLASTKKYRTTEESSGFRKAKE